MSKNILKWGKPSIFQKAPSETPLDAAVVYAKTTDTNVDATKTYYTEASGVYTAVASPTAGNIGTYYEAKSTWTDMDMPKEGSLQLNTQDGQETTAVEEGGEIVDVHYGKSTYDLQWDEFDKDGVPAFEDNDGIVEEETAIRMLPENDDLKGFYIPRAKVRVTTSYTVADGVTRHYNCKIMKPTTPGLKSLMEFVKADMAQA